MNWSDVSISEKAIRLVAIAIGTIFLRYQISLDEGTVFDVFLMISAWCLLRAGCFYSVQKSSSGLYWLV
jgi:hypothetical protein